VSKLDEQFESVLKREALERNLQLPALSELAPDAPAPRLGELVAQNGSEPTARALAAWEGRLQGQPIIDVAHTLGVSIESAKALIKEVHQAIAEDLKDNLEINRSLDLARIDGLLAAHYPRAKAGKVKSSQLVLRCLERRAKLTGIEPVPEHGPNKQPQNVLIWLQAKLPSISQLVDSLPTE
jgi:hypothetical protein